MIVELIHARGHGNILSTHRSTLEFTKATHLTKRGDCIVAVSADKAMPELSDDFKRALKFEGAVLEVVIECGGVRDTVTAYGSPQLILTHPTDIVIRRSNFICPRTLAVGANKSSRDLCRDIVVKLRAGYDVNITLLVR